MKSLWVILFIIVCLLPAKASPASEPNELLLLSEYSSARLVQLRLVLKQTSKYMADNPSPNLLSGHFALKSIQEGVPGLRSILVIAADGSLQFDSYNPVLWSVDLSGRKYFKSAMASKAGNMVISLPVTGKQSGQVFVPVTAKLAGGAGVAMASVEVDFLLPALNLCQGCGFGVLAGDDVLASYPPQARLPASVPAAIARGGEYGQKLLEINKVKIELHWKKSTEFPLTFVYYKSYVADY